MANALITSAILKHYSSSLTSSSVDEKSANFHSHEIVPLTIFDKATHDCHEDVYLVFKPPMPSNEVLKDALSKVLVYYPHLTGRFVTDNLGRICIILNNAGVRITETYIPTTLDEQLPFDASKDGCHLIPSVKGVEELCQVQLNRYKCGGLVLGFTAHHRVADGQSILDNKGRKRGRKFSNLDFLLQFLPLLSAKLAPIGRDLGFTAHHRVADGQSILYAVSQPRNPPRVEFDHGSIEFKKSTINLDNTVVFSSSSFETVIVNYSVELINKLKDMVSNNQDQRYSTFVCLLSHVWKKVTQARGLGLEESSQVRIAVNGRHRISEPAVPMEYFGNLVLWAYPRLKVKELVNESCAYIAKSIRDEVNRVNDRYFKSFIDFGATILQGGGDSDESDELQQTTPEFGSSLCPDLEADSWLGFQVHDIDFGSGSPCAIFPPSIPFEGLVVFIPAGTEDGGVDVKLTLFAEHARLFKKIAHSVDGKLTPTEIAF